MRHLALEISLWKPESPIHDVRRAQTARLLDRVGHEDRGLTPGKPPCTARLLITRTRPLPLGPVPIPVSPSLSLRHASLEGRARPVGSSCPSAAPSSPALLSGGTRAAGLKPVFFSLHCGLDSPSPLSFAFPLSPHNDWWFVDPWLWFCKLINSFGTRPQCESLLCLIWTVRRDLTLVFPPVS